MPTAPKEPVPHGLDESRVEEVEMFIASDPIAVRYFLFFDALRLRGVDALQSARTAHLVTTGETPREHFGLDRSAS